MADKSKIEWTDASWTPIRARNKVTGKVGWHCEHATPGCEHCYSESMNKRLGTGLPFKPGHRKDIEVFLDEKLLADPLRWKRPRMIFVCSMTDLFADFVPDEWIDRVFAVMALCPLHTFQVLTKRAERMRAFMKRMDAAHAEAVLRMEMTPAGAAGTSMIDAFPQYVSSLAHPSQHCIWPLPNVWLGVSAEDQRRVDERIPVLLETPAATRFVSAEPLLGPIDLLEYLVWDESMMHWIIVGGESGPSARPMHPDWARAIRDQCRAASVPFFFKQWGEYDGHNYPMRVGKRAADRHLDGREHNEMPEARP